ncbi:pYEATS domain-containing protein [Fluviicola taffensis]|uniref:Peptidase C1A papain n=1 Tax=Fluviicola taffensis (strain DSM 16823 / NCIMB 13979 / RW262) TaxID=755732 RepID=F2IFK4_FLUTR|nr:C1 family peptidase [Fluviicola taffensis]AEA45718.1 peptidase C1A papain [Fluviicola taffensis DSM 16823]
MKTLYTLLILLCAFSSWSQEQATGYTPMPNGEYEKLKIAFSSPFTERNLPASYVIPESYFPNPGSQGQIGSCVAWSTTYALASFYFAAKNKWGSPKTTNMIMSPAFVYNQIRECTCGPNCGTYVHDALNLLKTKGVVTWQTMPYDNANSCSVPSQELVNQASKYRISGWNRLINRLNFNEFKEHLSNDVPVVIGSCLGSGFSNYGYKKSASPFSCTQVTSGGHAMLVVGYDDNKRAFKIMNSWGKDWGVNGYIWVDYDCFKLMMSSYGAEAYVINKDYELGNSDNPVENPSSNISASSFTPYGHWERIATGHFYIDYGLNIAANVQPLVDRVTYVYDHSAFPNKYITVSSGPHYQTSYEGPYCLPNMQAIVYLKDGKSIKVEFNGCETINQVTRDDLSTFDIHPIVTAVPKTNQSGYYNFDIRLRGVENVKDRIVKVVYDFNHPTFKNRYITVTDKTNSFRVGYDGWGCLRGLGATVYFDDNTSKTFSINMCDILGW